MDSGAPRSRPGVRRAVALDVIRWVWHSRSWAVAVVLAMVVASVVVAGAGQATVPWLIYGGL